MINQEPYIPIFYQRWWLNNATKQGKLYFHYGEDNTEQVCLPIYLEAQWGIHRPMLPVLTPYFGYMRNEDLAQVDGLNHIRQANYLEKIICQLIKPHYISHPEDQFSHKHFYSSKSHQFTYILYKQKDVDSVWSALRYETRNKIRKSQKHFQFCISDDIDEAYSIVLHSMKKNNAKLKLKADTFKHIHQEVISRQQGCLLAAKNQEGQTHAVCFLVWDEKYLYAILRASTEEGYRLAAMNGLVWEGIQMAHQKGLHFDFVGSNKPGIAAFIEGYKSLKKDIRVMKLR